MNDGTKERARQIADTLIADVVAGRLEYIGLTQVIRRCEKSWIYPERDEDLINWTCRYTGDWDMKVLDPIIQELPWYVRRLWTSKARRRRISRAFQRQAVAAQIENITPTDSLLMRHAEASAPTDKPDINYRPSRSA